MAIIDLDTLVTQTVWTQPVPNYDPELYISERFYVSARDGVEIPCTLTRRRDNVEPDKVYLYGYGSYGMTIEPTFSGTTFTFLDQGFVHVIAHVRGSSMKGESCHFAG